MSAWLSLINQTVKSSYNRGRLCFYLTGVCRGNSLSPLNSVWHSHPIVFLFFPPFHYSYHYFFISSLGHLSSLWQAFKYRITCCLTQNQIYLSCPINGAVSLFILYIHSPKLLDHVLCFDLDKLFYLVLNVINHWVCSTQENLKFKVRFVIHQKI